MSDSPKTVIATRVYDLEKAREAGRIGGLRKAANRRLRSQQIVLSGDEAAALLAAYDILAKAAARARAALDVEMNGHDPDQAG